jgi:hypothetical protein
MSYLKCQLGGKCLRSMSPRQAPMRNDGAPSANIDAGSLEASAARGVQVRPRRRAILNECLAGHAYPLAADMAFDSEDARHVVELLGDVFADALHRAAAAAVRVGGFVPSARGCNHAGFAS